MPLAVAPEDLPTTVRAGSVVDVWVLPDRDRGNDEKTVRVLAGVPVLKLDDASDALSPQDSRQVIVTLPAGDDRLSHALATMAGGRVLLTRRD